MGAAARLMSAARRERELVAELAVFRARLPAVRIRAAHDGDVAAVTDLRLAFMAEERDLDLEAVRAELRAETLAFLAGHHQVGTAVSWLAEHDDHGVVTPIGAATLLLRELPPRPDDVHSLEGYLVNMYVVPAQRRHGVGAALLDRCLDEATDLGVHRVTLFATDAGRPMYERSGFVATDRWLHLPLPRVPDSAEVRGT